MLISTNSPPGSPAIQSSYPAKLFGISGSLFHIALICNLHKISTGSILLALDGLEALNAASGSFPLHPKFSAFDLITDICHCIATLPIDVKWQWVQEHQDSLGVDNLDLLACLNIQA